MLKANILSDAIKKLIMSAVCVLHVGGWVGVCIGGWGWVGIYAFMCAFGKTVETITSSLLKRDYVSLNFSALCLRGPTWLDHLSLLFLLSQDVAMLTSSTLSSWCRKKA